MRNWLLVLSGPVLAAVIWLVWRVQDLPLQPAFLAGFFSIDSLSAFFMLLFVVVALCLIMQRKMPLLSGLLALLVLLVAAAAASLFVVAVAFLLVTVLHLSAQRKAQNVVLSAEYTTENVEPGVLGRRWVWWRCVGTGLARLDAYPATPGAFWYAAGIWSFLPCVCLWIAYGGLATQVHTWRYTLPVAGTGLTSFVFWFVLLATLLGSTLRVWDLWRSNSPSLARRSTNLLLTVAWFYPLARLYSLGPWNVGWHLAAILLGTAMALWAAWRAVLARVYVPTTRWLVQVFLGLTLVEMGMGTSAGIVAACYALLVVVLLSTGMEPPDAEHTAQSREGESVERRSEWVRRAVWLLCGAIPLTAPFVAVWMSISAAAAGGMFLLAGLLWIASLLAVLTTMRLATQPDIPVLPGQILPAALAGIVLGVTSPLVLRWLIRPVVEQLQGGLTPFGDITLWPWGGLVALNSARQQVATLPSLTIFALMLVLGALAWLLLRLRMALIDMKKSNERNT